MIIKTDYYVVRFRDKYCITRTVHSKHKILFLFSTHSTDVKVLRHIVRDDCSNYEPFSSQWWMSNNSESNDSWKKFDTLEQAKRARNLIMEIDSRWISKTEMEIIDGESVHEPEKFNGGQSLSDFKRDNYDYDDYDETV